MCRSARPGPLTAQRRISWRSRPSLTIVASWLLVVTALSGCSSSTSSNKPLGFRSLPSFLPSSATPVDGVVTASAAHAQLAVQGVGVQIELPTGMGLATVTGPRVPPFVAPPPESVTATFDILITHVTGTIPIRLGDFTITDQLGRTFAPTLVLGEAPPPSSVADGATVDFQVDAVMPTGEGRLYWSPTGGAPIVGWDFIVEND